MLGNKKNQNKTVFGGIGIALLLCALMALMPMSGFMSNDSADVEFVESSTTGEEDFFRLPDKIEEIEYEYDPSLELQGMRDEKTKAYLTEDGNIAQLIATEPVHYRTNEGTWENIDVNIKAMPEGWSVTENTFVTHFGPEAGSGIMVQANQFVDPVLSGLNPMLVTLDETGTAPEPYFSAPSTSGIEVGGNVIRYPLAEGFDLDYTVDSTQVKQNLVVREAPVLQENAVWFGLSEGLRIPAGYALYSGETQLGEDVFQTSEALHIRSIETGEVLLEIPTPVIIDATGAEPYTGTFFVQVYGPDVILTTVVETSWLLSEDRVYPVGIDPTLKVNVGSGGYCYVYYANCYSNSLRYLYKYYSSVYYLPWHKVTFTSSNALPTGAAIQSIQWKEHISSLSYASSSANVNVKIMQSCGLDNKYNSAVTTRTCSSSAISPSYVTQNYGGTAGRSMVSSIWNSATVGTIKAGGTGWKTGTLCNTATACSSTSGGIGLINSALSNAGTSSGSVGVGEQYTGSRILRYGYSSGSNVYHLAMVYTGGTDADAPTSDYVPYTGIDSYIEGERTFFITLTDMSGIDTTSSNAPKLFYSTNGGTSWASTSYGLGSNNQFDAGELVSIGSCSSTTTDCRFKARTPDVTFGDDFRYYWKYQDLNTGSNGPNVGHEPALTGAQQTPTPYQFDVVDPANAPATSKKMTVLTTDVTAYSSYNAGGNFDRQLTYFAANDEYYFEFDTSACGTGSSSCFYTGTSTTYGNWLARWSDKPAYGYWGMNSYTNKGNQNLWNNNGNGYLQVAAKDGPGMNLIMHYDSVDNAWATVGIGTETGIEAALTGGSSASLSYSYGSYTKAYKFAIPGDITGDFGMFTFNSTASSTTANRMCVTTNGWYYFYRATSSYDRCTPAYYMIYGNQNSYRWSGFAMGSSYYGRQASTGDITYKVGNVAPTPDIYKPTFTHTAMADSHSKIRTVSVSIIDAGDPASGVNTSTSAGVGPTLYHRITPDGGSAGTWTTTVMDHEAGNQRDDCSLKECTWTAEIEDLEVNDSVEYYFTARDVSTVSAGININTSSTYSFERGDPNKVFAVEWHDMSYYTYGYLCTVQALFYDVTNEIEFKYDSGCSANYESWEIGYMDQTRNKGDSISNKGGSYNSQGYTPTASNFRIHTSATADGWETFDKGLVELANANTALSGSSNGRPYAYYCWYYFSSYANQCSANIDIPAGFEFDYFGTTYDGDDSNDRVQINRQGSMFFLDNGNTNVQRTLWTWHQPELPYKGSSYAKPGLIAPFNTVYNNYYCFVTSNQDCSTYYRVMPYEGKGTDVSADITADPNWDLTDSPIRINPSSKYLVVSSDLTIEPGVEIQIAAGKGISFDGGCTKFFANGSATAPINFTGMNGADWLGMAFTNECTTAGGTDDRHVFKNVNFNDTTDSVFRSGSRHDGTGPSCGSATADCNTGNFTMSDVTFENVGSVFTHGSGQGTSVSMTDFTVSGVTGSCFDFAENTVAVLMEGTVTNCNTAGTATDGAVMSVPGSTSGLLHMENMSFTNSYKNFIDVDLEDLFLSNVTVVSPSTSGATSGSAITSDAGPDSDVYMYNVEFSGQAYASATVAAMESIYIDGLDLMTTSLDVIPGGNSQTGNGPSSTSMTLMDITSGDLTMKRVHPGVFDDITANAVSLTGNHITSEVLTMNGFDADSFTVTGCGWSVNMVAPTLDRVKSSASCATSKNTMTVSDATFTHGSSTEHVIDGRNSHITVGESSISSTSAAASGPYVAKARSGTNIVLIASDLNGNDCSGSSGDTGSCSIDVSSSSSNPSMVYFGGLASVRLYRLDSSNQPAYKANHVVTTSLVDASLSEMFQVGLHKTSSVQSDLGNASVWVVVGDSDSNSFEDHIIRAFGSAGQNETYPDNFPDATLSSSWYPAAGFTLGTHMDLKLEPAPITFNDPATDCNAMRNNVNLSGAYTPSTDTFAWDDTKITITENILIDGCHLRMDGGVLRVQSTATNAPVITITSGGSLTVTNDGTEATPGTIRAVSPTYGLNLDIQDGSLVLDNGILRDVACDTTTMGCLNINNGATLIMMDSGTIYGSSATSDEMATVKVDGGSVNIDGSSIINDGQTGTALWVQNSGGTITDITVKNAAVGIQAYNGAPQVDGFIANGNTVGVSAYGGMSLPTIYRSTILSGMSAGWETYEIDLSTYLGTGEYLQVGANSIYAGGNAHPTYNYFSSKYYFITDRMNIEFTDDNGNSWNVTDGDQKGYYPYSSSDPAINSNADVGSYSGGVGGAPSWHCNYYGYDYGPNYQSQDGYYYYMHRYWLNQNGNSYQQPDEFGFRWESIEDVSPTGYYQSRYPYKYWGYYSPANYFQGAFSPPEGANGQSGWVGAGSPPSYAQGGYPNNYGICLDYAYTYYMNAGQGARTTFPIVDISGATAYGGNISKVSLWIDVLHKGADNYQDRYDFVARSGNDPASLGEYVRESGTAKFENGQIIGSDVGIDIGGAYAAGVFENIEITAPTTAGVYVTGSTAASSSNINVTGGDYAVLSGTSASGRFDLQNVDFENQNLAGIYYLKNLNTEFSGSITGGQGPALKYGLDTDRSVELSGLSIKTNAIGIESLGSTDFVLKDVELNNTQHDVAMSGSSSMDFIEGDLNISTVEVTGTGVFTRMREVDITVTADVVSGSTTTTEDVEGTNVVLKDPDGVVTGMAETDSNGVASDLTFVTQTVDAGSCSSVCTPSLTGYTAVTVATIDYFWTSSSNNADFRYAFEEMSLNNMPDNVETIDLVETFDSRICYRYTSTSYIQQNACSSLGTGSTRTFSNGLVEYGYYYTISGNDIAGETVMFDAPFLYLDGGTHNWNQTEIISTASYTFDNANRFYPSYRDEVNLWMHNTNITATAVSSEGEMQGFQLGYQYYSMNLDMDRSSISGLASIWGSIGYGSYNEYELDHFQITNSTFTHFKGYTALNSAIQNTDICVQINGGEESLIYNNTFYDCGAGVQLERSPYYYSHSASELGADNVTIDSNRFYDGGEIADVWVYSSSQADGTIITNNEFNPNGGRAISVYAGKATDMLIQDNTIVGGKNAISLNTVSNFTIHNNTIGGISDPASTGIQVFKGTGDVTNNTLVDADGGIYLSEMRSPPQPTNSLCSISSSGYRTSDSCNFNIASGKSADVNLGTDNWGYEISITIDLPDGTTDSWGTYSFGSNTEYLPLKTYSDAGAYTLTVRDSFGDGGATINVLESTGGSTGYAGPDISGNTIGLSAGRVSPNAVGITAVDCDAVTILSGSNTVTLGDNAIVIEDCDFSDEGSTLTGSGDASTAGIVGDDTNTFINLDGTTISGYAVGLTKENGDLSMIGGTDIAGSDYGVQVESTSVTAINAAVDGGATGTGLYVVDSSDVWVYPMDASGLIGVHIDNTPFRWDGGISDATTAIYVEDSIGSVENLTWSASTTQINAGPRSHVTSIGNTLLSGAITIDSTSIIDEANLLSIETTHLGDLPQDEVALLVTSTDDERASYVSTSFQPETMSVDGSNDDWVGGNALNPSGYAMPGNMSGDGTDDFYVTYVEGDSLYLGMTGSDLTSSDVLIYLSVDGSGSDVGYNGLGGAHNLPFSANYVLWADSDSSYDLYSYGFLGWTRSALSTANVDADFSSSLGEISIPWSRIGGMPDQIDIVAIVQEETTADITTVHPSQALDGTATLQNLTNFMTVELNHGDLMTGTLNDEVLVYRSYKGVATASEAKNYNIMLKTPADCAYDWATIEDVSMATNVAFDDSYTAGTGDTTDVRATVDILRACPVIDTEATASPSDGLASFDKDEDSSAFTFSLTNLVDDVQDAEIDLDWVVTEGTLVAFDNVLVDWAQNGQDVTITPLTDQFGTVVFSFEVTDSNGLTDSHNITYTVNNVNDKPVICNNERVLTDCMPIISEDGSFNNILPEGFGIHTKFLGDVSNATRSYIRDMANEQSPSRQTYTWGASIPTTCEAFTVDVVNNELTITENTANEKGGTCMMTLSLSDDGAENVDADTFDVAFSVSPVNDAPVIRDWDAANGTTIVNKANLPINQAWKLVMTEDDTNEDNLTFDLSAVKADVDHEMDDLLWTVESTDQCTYTNYFTATIIGDDLVFDLIEDAATDVPNEERDYLNNAGIHQIPPTGSSYCEITLVLRDTPTAPIVDGEYNTHIPNYDTSLMPIADYEQGVATKTIGVKVTNVPEQVPDYAFDAVTGFSFNGVTNVMTGTYVPVTVTIDGAGDPGPYRYDHMLAVTYHSDGHTDIEQTRYYDVPDYNTAVKLTEDVYVTRDTTHVWVEMDVLTCLDNPCDLTKSTTDRFIADNPESHYRVINGVQSDEPWSAPGRYGQDATASSIRRPLLEDSNWCNNIMTSLPAADPCNAADQDTADSSFLSTSQDIPTVVDTVGASAVPSFAPSIIAVSMVGLFVSALTFSSRRADDEEEVVERMKDDETAVSPVIATILMVAITVVLSGVIYVWASSLAETDVKGVPRITFQMEDVNGVDADEGHWRISVMNAQTALATQAVEVRVIYQNSTGGQSVVTVNLAESAGVYGFNPANSDSFVTFVDSVDRDGNRSISTFNSGDTIFVRTHAPDGTPLTGVTITITYAPPNGNGAELTKWSNLAYDKKA